MITTIVKAEFGILLSELKHPLRHAIEFGEPAFNVAPEVLDTAMLLPASVYL